MLRAHLDWKFQSELLSFSKINGSHTGGNTGEELYMLRLCLNIGWHWIGNVGDDQCSLVMLALTGDGW